MTERRNDFLIEMYNQMYNDIDRHILVVWQSIGVLVSAFAIFALVEKEIISIDLASAIIALLCAWLFAHLMDASYWYNRNLVIIANIERQFLEVSDLKKIHYYFGVHRPSNRMITHLKIQMALGIGLGALVLLFHFSTRVFPGFVEPWSTFDPARTLPYLVSVGAFTYCSWLSRDRDSAYAEFLKNSPGEPVDTTGISYGSGHGFGPSGGG